MGGSRNLLAMGEDLARAYAAYLTRFQSQLGDSDFGVFVKHNGRLIQKLRFEEFEPIYGEYCEMAEKYREAVARGDTINDIIVRLMRDRAAHLVLPSPV
jgi:hypothetical protein